MTIGCSELLARAMYGTDQSLWRCYASNSHDLMGKPARVQADVIVRPTLLRMPFCGDECVFLSTVMSECLAQENPCITILQFRNYFFNVFFERGIPNGVTCSLSLVFCLSFSLAVNTHPDTLLPHNCALVFTCCLINALTLAQVAPSTVGVRCLTVEILVCTKKLTNRLRLRGTESN